MQRQARRITVAAATAVAVLAITALCGAASAHAANLNHGDGYSSGATDLAGPRQGRWAALLSAALSAVRPAVPSATASSGAPPGSASAGA